MILFLTGNKPDLAPDLLFNGLVQLFGQDKIIDFPYLEYRHKKVITGHGRDYFCITTDKDAENRNIYNFEDIKQLLNKELFDICIVANRSLDTYIRLTKNITKSLRTVIVNGEDHSDHSLKNIFNSLSKHKIDMNNIDLILQRDYKYNGNYNDNIVPYNFSLPINILPKFDFKKDKEIDIFAQFPVTHRFRHKVIERLKKIKGIKTDIKANIGYGGLSIIDYFKSMNNSKISISITGAGWDTPHYLEVPFMKSMLLAQHPMDAMNPDMTKNPVVFIKNFLDKYSATFYNTNLDNTNTNDTNIDNIEELIRYYLENDKEREQITKRGYEHLKNCLTTKHAAEYMLKCIDDNNYWRSNIV